MPQDHHQIKTVQMPNDVFLPFVIEQLNEGHTATLPLRGRSMRPFLEDGRDKALLQLCDHPQVGDAVLAEISKGLFVLHRIIRIEGRQTLDRTDGRKWRLYSWWWTRLYPLRRYLLFIIYPHIPKRFK